MSGTMKRSQKRPRITLEERRESLVPSNLKKVRRIVEAVGKVVGFDPTTLDREDLASDLEDASLNFDIRQSLDEWPSDDALNDHFSRIEFAAQKLVKALGVEGGKDIADVHPAVWSALSRYKPDGVEDTSEMVLSVWRLYQTAKSFRKDPDPDESDGVPKFPIENGRDAALQYIITKRLPAIYKKHFSRKFGISINRGRSGPGLRFIQAALTENGHPMEPEAIKRRFFSRG
jgi:hypothetical protein